MSLEDSDPSVAEELAEQWGGGTEARERVLAELADLSVAREELRAAEAELDSQRNQLEALIRQHADDRRWRGHVSGLTGVALCSTDGAGKVVDANPALADLLGVALPRLRGKPLSVYLQGTDAGDFRGALRRLRSGVDSEHRSEVGIRGRQGTQLPGQLLGFPEVVSPEVGLARVSWLIIPALPDTVPADGTTDAPPRALPRTSPPEVAASGSSSAMAAAAVALAELTALGLADDDRRRLLSRMATVVRVAVPAADWVSLTLGHPKDPLLLGTDSVEAQQLDAHQLRAEEGPCWAAFETGTPVSTGGLAEDPRWPVLGALLGSSPVHSVLALPLGTERQPGVLNLYAAAAEAFSPDSRPLAELVGAAAAGVLQNVAERESLRALTGNLEAALTSRAIIDQAKGVLMARLDVDADEAFARLVALSNRLNVKVRDLAQLVVKGGADEVIEAATR